MNPRVLLVGLGLASVVAAGWFATVGAGALGLVAGLLGLWRGQAAGARLVVLWAALVMLAGLVVVPGWPQVLGVAGVLALWRGAPPVGAEPVWRIPWGVPLVVGLVALAWSVVPAWLPVQQVVHARPWVDTLPVGAALALGALALGALGTRRLPSTVAWALLASGAVALGHAAMVLVGGATGDGATVVDRAETARTLGMRATQRELLAALMEREAAAGHPDKVVALWEAASAEDEAVRRDSRLLWRAAWGLEALGGPPSDVDALLRRALRWAPAANVVDWNVWPGADRVKPAAMRAGARVAPELGAPAALPRDGVTDCYAGTWCLHGVTLPPMRAGERQANVEVRWTQVAPAAVDVLLELQLGWGGWRATSILTAGGHGVGETFVVVVPVDLQTPPGTPQEVWLRLFPTDGGAPLPLERKPGPSLRVAVWNPQGATDPVSPDTTR